MSARILLADGYYLANTTILVTKPTLIYYDILLCRQLRHRRQLQLTDTELHPNSEKLSMNNTKLSCAGFEHTALRHGGCIEATALTATPIVQ